MLRRCSMSEAPWDAKAPVSGEWKVPRYQDDQRLITCRL